VAYVLALRADLTWLWVLLGFLVALSYVSYCVAAARVIRRYRVLRRQRLSADPDYWTWNHVAEDRVQVRMANTRPDMAAAPESVR